MGFLYFFDRYIKPLMLRGTQMLHPASTGKLGHGVSCIRQGDVNLWFYTKGGTTLAVDAGHLNEPNMDKAFESAGIDPLKIHHLLLTHADVDHCGGIDAKAKKNIFPNAQVYLGEKEKPYLDKTLHRMVRAHKKIYNCVRLRPGFRLLKDEETLNLDGISVRCILVPGHTAGHMCYLLDNRILFSGDCLAVNRDGGYAFWDFFCQFPEQNKKSLVHLREALDGVSLTAVCTGHSGFVTDTEKLFAHIDRSAAFRGKLPFDESAPLDVCRR
ncbi:MAG: MBL fold metallo-hydrolase [Candidatus Limivicinus sp.]|jgi:hydroxyacylglutathione hydrolase